MRCFTPLLTFGLALAPWAFAAGPPPPAPRPVPGDSQDVVFLHKSRPYLIRLHLQVRGRNFQEEWNAIVGRLFKHLDANGDGVLSKEELARAPSVEQWRQMVQTGGHLDPDDSPDWDELRAGKDHVTLAQVRAYYRRSKAGPLQVQWGWRPSVADRLSDELMRHLDRDHDGKLSRRELLDAERVLAKLDVNGDELITVNELTPGSRETGLTLRRGPAHGPASGGLPFLLIQPGQPAGEFTRALVARYDRDGDKKLTPAELGLEKPLFDRLDRNRDGLLDEGELARFPELPPDLELVIALEPSARDPVPLAPPRKGVSVRQARHGRLLIPVADSQIELERVRGGPPGRTAFRAQALEMFRSLDANKDGFVDEKEAFRPPFTFVGYLRLADRDGDGKVSRKEFAAFLDLQEKVHATTTYLTVVDRGRTLFGFIDGDHDNRLSPRELRTAWARLAPWCRGRGAITPDDIPQQFQVVLSHGQPFVTQSAFGLGPSGPVKRTRGPLWFRKMDRNNDGDVSRSEFLGTDEQFRAIDADGDGLIDAEEAERYDKEVRKKKK
jgi:Ca2+-binding EF-hand superfamily protein